MASPFRRNNNSPEPSPYNAPRGITAAATRMDLRSVSEADQFRKRQGSATAAWQHAAWEYYDAISEIKYAFNLVAAITSRIRLYAAYIEDPSEAPIAISEATKLNPTLGDAAIRHLARLDSAFGGQAGLLRDAALNLSVAGECYLVQVPARPGQGLPESWDIRSISELRIDQRGNYVVYQSRDMSAGNSSSLPNGAIQLPPSAFMGRIWRPHPQFSFDPDSSMLGLLGLCEELLLLDRTFRGSHRSRLNAGMLYVPDGMSTSASPDADLFAEPEEEQPTPEDLADEFQEELLLAMSTPIEDETSASSVVPLLVRGPAELADKIKHITFSRPFDASMVARADRVLDRILQGLDVPKDTVTGLANVKYSNAIQIDESLYKAHIEPMIQLICDALTVVYLKPSLIEAGWSQADVANLTVWYDASSVATRNDRAADADSGFEKMAISASKWRETHGFSDADAPTGKELVLRMLMEKGGLDPQLTEALLRVIAPEIIEAARGGNQGGVGAIPGEVDNLLNGGQPGAEAVPADPNAPIGLAEPGGTVVESVVPEADVAPGEDAPPFPLAEPGDNPEETV